MHVFEHSAELGITIFRKWIFSQGMVILDLKQGCLKLQWLLIYSTHNLYLVTSKCAFADRGSNKVLIIEAEFQPAEVDSCFKSQTHDFVKHVCVLTRQNSLIGHETSFMTSRGWLHHHEAGYLLHESWFMKLFHDFIWQAVDLTRQTKVSLVQADL